MHVVSSIHTTKYMFCRTTEHGEEVVARTYSRSSRSRRRSRRCRRGGGGMAGGRPTVEKYMVE